MSNHLENLQLSILPNEPLSHYTTFQLGGPCKALIECQTPQQLKDAVKELNAVGEKFILIGGGSNLVVSDQGVDCSVIRYLSEDPMITRKDCQVEVSGSTLLDDLAKWAAHEGLSGVNCTTGIPGTVGGAVVGNAGAFGKQIGDVLRTATLLSTSREERVVMQKDCGFAYRHSNLKKGNDIVVSVCLELQKGDKDKLLKEREEILAVRKSKHPNLSQDPCAGSFFRNIEPTSSAGKRQAAGWFLEQAGGKELSVGGAQIFSKHANIIIKGPNCTSQDVYELSQKMAELAKARFDLDLVREVRFVGLFEGGRNASEIIW